MKSIVTEIFCFVDEFVKNFESELTKMMIESGEKKRKPTNKTIMSMSEIITILIMYSFSYSKNFKYYYLLFIDRKSFPNLVSYNRFIELMPRALPYLAALVSWCKGEQTGTYFVDSTSLPICSNKRISSNKVFKGLAATGKTTKGWFHGFKLHVIINEKGEIMNIKITKGNTNDVSVLENLVSGLIGKLYGDKGYISAKVAQRLFLKNLQLITGIKKTMKNKLMPIYDKIMLRKRSLIETVFDFMKNKFNLEHSRHRSHWNFLVHILSTVLAYQFKENKPKISKFYNVIL